MCLGLIKVFDYKSNKLVLKALKYLDDYLFLNNNRLNYFIIENI